VRVASIVFVETLWVLHRRYRVTREEVSRIARELLDHHRYQVEGSGGLGRALEIFSATRIDFADAVALADARAAGLTLHTFDRTLAKLADAIIVE
jgi:predicted nucleic-acid-binding protein